MNIIFLRSVSIAALFGAGTAGGTLLGAAETDGLAADFTSTTVDLLIRDSGATLNYSGLPFNADGGKLTFTRASSATRVNSSGNIETVSSDVGRIDHTSAGVKRGFLMEEARTNLFIRSEELDNASWTKIDCTITANDTTSPSGSADADKMVRTSTGALQFALASITTTAIDYTVSVFAKAGTQNFFYIQINEDSNSNAIFYSFDLTNGSIGSKQTLVGSVTAASTSATDYGNGWYRCAITFTGGSSDTRIFLGSADVTNVRTGTNGGTLYLYGAQLEAGSFPTSYIPTTTATVTRAVDANSAATSLFPYSATAGTLFAEFTPMNVAAARRAIQLDDTTANERVTIATDATPNGLFTVIDGGASQAAIATGTPAANTAIKMAASWAANDFALSVNGAAASTDVSGTLPTMTTLRFGSGPSAAEPLNGWIRKVVVLNRAMSDAELATRST
jgi:hypothetical protein